MLLLLNVLFLRRELLGVTKICNHKMNQAVLESGCRIAPGHVWGSWARPLEFLQLSKDALFSGTVSAILSLSWLFIAAFFCIHFFKL